MTRVFRAVILALALFGVAVLNQAQASPAPKFTLADLNGAPISLDDYRGKLVVLEWTNHECPFVKKFYSVGKMQELQEYVTKAGGIWLTINSSAPGKQGALTPAEALALTKDQKSRSSHFLLDPTGQVGRSYQAKTTPHMFLIDKNGEIAYSGAIDDTASTDSSDISGSKNHIKTAFDEINSGKPVSLAATAPYGCSVKYGS
jgi:glutathione peroxidase-family protein